MEISSRPLIVPSASHRNTRTQPEAPHVIDRKETDPRSHIHPEKITIRIRSFALMIVAPVHAVPKEISAIDLQRGCVTLTIILFKAVRWFRSRSQFDLSHLMTSR